METLRVLAALSGKAEQLFPILRFVACCLLPAAVLRLAAAVCRRRLTKRMERCSVSTYGVVEDIYDPFYDLSLPGEGRGAVCVVVRYDTEDERITAKSGLISSPPFPIGGTAEIRYNPRDVEEFYFPRLYERKMRMLRSLTVLSNVLAVLGAGYCFLALF